MPQPMRAHDRDDSGAPLRPGGSAASGTAAEETAARAREHAEAEAALAAVMLREEVKAGALAANESRSRTHKRPLKLLLLLTLIAFNLYAWLGNPEWLRFEGPHLPAPSYYASSWKIAVYLQRQRIEEYRLRHGRLPATALQAGPPVKGVQYKPLEADTYQLAAGDAMRRFVYLSSDSAAVLVGRAFVQMSLVAGGMR